MHKCPDKGEKSVSMFNIIKCVECQVCTMQCVRFYGNKKMKLIQTHALEKMPVNDYHLLVPLP